VPDWLGMFFNLEHILEYFISILKFLGHDDERAKGKVNGERNVKSINRIYKVHKKLNLQCK
jgi:hypothetical protein